MKDNKEKGFALSKLHQDMLYQPAYEASSVSFLVEKMAGTYHEISHLHLMPLVNKVNGLLALVGDDNAVKLKIEQTQLQNQAVEMQESITDIIKRNKDEYNAKVEKRKTQLENTLNKFVPDLPAQQQAHIQESLDVTNQVLASHDDYSLDDFA